MPAFLDVKTYDPKNVIITFGPNIISGYAEGSFVTITRGGNLFEKRQGSDGSVDRINKNTRHYEVTITLMQTSPTNDILSAIALLDITTNTGKLPLTIKDVNGTTTFFAKQAWIQKDPDDEDGDSLGSREWVLATGIADKFTGGNI